MSIDMLELAAEHLGEMLEEVVFVGGASLGLWISDPGAPPVRPTKDVDVIVEVTTRSEFHAVEERLRLQRFDEDQEDGVICRRRHRDSGLVLDVMPSAGEILGFENRWQREALPHARAVTLPSGRIIRAVSPPYLLATKLEAFGRGVEVTSSAVATSAMSWFSSTAARNSSAKSSPPNTVCALSRGHPHGVLAGTGL